MHYFLTLLFVLPQVPKVVPERDLSRLVTGVERSFATMKDLSADFVQIVQDASNRKQQASGHLYLMRPRKGRWEYKNPEGNLWVSDGKTVWFYVEADRQVNRQAVRETFDDRMPLMFLLGTSNLRAEFTKFTLLNAKPLVEGTAVIQMFPKRKTDLADLVMEVDPANYQIRRLLLTYSDGSKSEFMFSAIHTNAGLKSSLFDFKVAPGVEIVEGFER